MNKVNIKVPSKTINKDEIYKTRNELYTNFLWINSVKNTSFDDLLKNSY
jgi:hypothetical protein